MQAMLLGARKSKIGKMKRMGKYQGQYNGCTMQIMLSKPYYCEGELTMKDESVLKSFQAEGISACIDCKAISCVDDCNCGTSVAMFQLICWLFVFCNDCIIDACSHFSFFLFFLSGEIVEGQIVVCACTPIAVGALTLKATGSESTHWEEERTRFVGEGQDKHSETYVEEFGEHRDFFRFKFMVTQTPGLNAGNYAFPFAFKLPSK